MRTLLNIMIAIILIVLTLIFINPLILTAPGYWYKSLTANKDGVTQKVLADLHMKYKEEFTVTNIQYDEMKDKYTVRCYPKRDQLLAFNVVVFKDSDDSLDIRDDYFLRKEHTNSIEQVFDPDDYLIDLELGFPDIYNDRGLAGVQIMNDSIHVYVYSRKPVTYESYSAESQKIMDLINWSRNSDIKLTRIVVLYFDEKKISQDGLLDTYLNYNEFQLLSKHGSKVFARFTLNEISKIAGVEQIDKYFVMEKR